MSIFAKQPEIRFNKAGPFDSGGVCYLPKILYFKKDEISGTSEDDFWAAPAGTFIQFAGIAAITALDGAGTAELGTDGNADALISTTDFDASTVGNFASSIGSTVTAGAIGLYLPDGDNIRLTIGGAPTVGEVAGFIQYVEMPAMESQGIHFDIA